MDAIRNAAKTLSVGVAEEEEDMSLGTGIPSVTLKSTDQFSTK